MIFVDAFAAMAADLDALDKTDELCCVAARDHTIRVYGAAVVGRAPIALWHLYRDCADAWAPVTACVLAGIADAKTIAKAGAIVALTPGHWHRVQGWRGTPFGTYIDNDGKVKPITGHTITVYAPLTGPKVLVFDSAKERNERVQWVVWTEYAAQYRGGQAACALREVAQ